MGHHAEVFVGIDVAKSRNAIAIADCERGGEVRYFGEVVSAPDAMRRVPCTQIKPSRTYGASSSVTRCFHLPVDERHWRTIKQMPHFALFGVGKSLPQLHLNVLRVD